MIASRSTKESHHRQGYGLIHRHVTNISTGRGGATRNSWAVLVEHVINFGVDHDDKKPAQLSNIPIVLLGLVPFGPLIVDPG